MQENVNVKPERILYSLLINKKVYRAYNQAYLAAYSNDLTLLNELDAATSFMFFDDGNTLIDTKDTHSIELGEIKLQYFACDYSSLRFALVKALAQKADFSLIESDIYNFCVSNAEAKALLEYLDADVKAKEQENAWYAANGDRYAEIVNGIFKKAGYKVVTA